MSDAFCIEDGDYMGRLVSPEKQFSKKLAGRAEWYWFLYLILIGVLIALQPSAALYLFLCGLLVSVVMETSVLAYTHNSEYEKGLWASLEAAKIGEKLPKVKAGVQSLTEITKPFQSQEETDDSDEEEETEDEEQINEDEDVIEDTEEEPEESEEDGNEE